MVGIVCPNAFAQCLKCFFLQVLLAKNGINTVFRTHFALADEQVRNLFRAPKLEIAVLVAVVIDTFVAMGLAAFGNIEIDDLLAVDFHRLKIEVVSRAEQLRVVHVLGQGVELRLHLCGVDANDLSIIVGTQYHMPASAVEEGADGFIHRARQTLLGKLELDLRSLSLG